MPLLIAIAVIAVVLIWLLPNPLGAGSNRPSEPFWRGLDSGGL